MSDIKIAVSGDLDPQVLAGVQRRLEMLQVQFEETAAPALNRIIDEALAETSRGLSLLGLPHSPEDVANVEAFFCQALTLFVLSWHRKRCGKVFDFSKIRYFEEPPTCVS